MNPPVVGGLGVVTGTLTYDWALCAPRAAPPPEFHSVAVGLALRAAMQVRTDAPACCVPSVQGAIGPRPRGACMPSGTVDWWGGRLHERGTGPRAARKSGNTEVAPSLRQGAHAWDHLRPVTTHCALHSAH